MLAQPPLKRYHRRVSQILKRIPDKPFRMQVKFIFLLSIEQSVVRKIIPSCRNNRIDLLFAI